MILIGNFLSGQVQGTILKKLCGNELNCFQKLVSDEHLSSVVPKFQNVVVVDGECNYLNRISLNIYSFNIIIFNSIS